LIKIIINNRKFFLKKTEIDSAKELSKASFLLEILKFETYQKMTERKSVNIEEDETNFYFVS